MDERFNILHSVWKLFRTPVRDWRLAVCDATTVDPADLVPADVMYHNTSPKIAWFISIGIRSGIGFQVRKTMKCLCSRPMTPTTKDPGVSPLLAYIKYMS